MIYVNDRTVKPQLAPKGKSFEQWITIASPAFQKRAVGRLQRFMAQETGYRYEALDHLPCWRDTFEVLSITSEIIGTGKDPAIHEAMVGFVWFTFDQEVPTLYNCYLHPSYRGENDQHNLMVRAWSTLNDRFSHFRIEGPVSGAFKAFLEKTMYVDTSHVVNLENALASRVQPQIQQPAETPTRTNRITN